MTDALAAAASGESDRLPALDDRPSPEEASRSAAVSAPIDKPVGVDVAGSIMASVSPVTKITIAKLEKIVERCHMLADRMVSHEQKVSAALDRRDDYVRDIISSHGRFAQGVEADVTEINTLLDKLESDHAELIASTMGGKE